jgi:hypothetical protein
MFIECLIKRSDGSDTFVDFEQVRYRFTKNSNGDHVCFVGGQGHQQRLLSMGTGSYRPYKPPQDLQGPQGGNPESMVFGNKQKKKPPPKPAILEQDVFEDTPPEESAKPGGLVDFDWDLNEKIQKLNSFKRLGPEQFKKFIDDNRHSVMLWPIDVRREVARKIEKILPESDPGIEGFDIDDYIGHTGDS